MSNISIYKRVNQWAVFSRQWWLFDAKHQDPFDAAQRIARYLHGKHKPIYDTEQDCGDHVIVYNARHVALPDKEWRNRMYFHHSQYAGGAKWTAAHQLHNDDPKSVIYKAIFRGVGNIGLKRHEMIARLHIFADDEIPDHLMENVTDHIRQLRPVPRALHEYSKEELDKYPKIFDYPEDYARK